jgi:large subunit ribosomal protein L10
MARPDKVQKVDELAKEFASSSGAVLTDYRGLTVTDATALRRGLREQDTTFVVAKNTLARLAAKKAGFDELLPMLEGPTAVAFLRGDAVASAKALLDLTKRYPAVEVKGALVDGLVMDGEQARSLATLDTKEVSLGKIAGMLQSPLARMVYLLQAPLARIAYAVGEHARRGGAGTEAAEGVAEPAEAEGVAEPAEAEAAAPAPEISADASAEPATGSEQEAPAEESEGEPAEAASENAAPSAEGESDAAEPAADEGATES